MATARKEYAQFFTCVELGDYDSVKTYITNGFDPMMVYKMDGKETTPIKSALRKGDAHVASVLLDSRKTKIGVYDLLTTSKKMEANTALVKKLAASVNSVDIDATDIGNSLKLYVKTNRLSTAHANYDLAKKVLDVKIKNRCPPTSSSEEEDEDPEDESEEDDDPEDESEDSSDESDGNDSNDD